MKRLLKILSIAIGLGTAPAVATFTAPVITSIAVAASFEVVAPVVVVSVVTGAIVFTPSTSTAQTSRWYLSASTAADVSPATNAGWNVTTSFDRMKMSTTKDGSTITTKNTAASGAAAKNVLNRMFVSEQIGACTLSAANSAIVQIQGNYNLLGGGTVTRAEMQLYIRVVSADGSTFRGTFFSGQVGTQYTTAIRNTGGGIGGSDVVAQNGDRIVFEVGWRFFTGTSTGSTATNRFGSSSGTDLPLDETTTASNNPWIEFGQTIPAYVPPAGGNKGMPLNMLSN